MNKKEIILISNLLEEAHNIFCNHGCNDIPEEWFNKWTKKDKNILLKEIKKYDFLDNENDFDSIGDDTLMSYYSKKLLNEIDEYIK